MTLSLRSSLRLMLIGLALTTGIPALAEKPDRDDKHGGKHDKHQKQDKREKHGSPRPDDRRDDGRVRELVRAPSPQVSVNIQIGSYFAQPQRQAAYAYYAPQFKAGKCPPGLAKKHNGCMPPGQAKKWRMGHPLPRDVVFYPVPHSVSMQIGSPPAGYRYVRVAADILLIAVGTSMVVDAIEDLGRL
ncbi:hypothetical protein [Hydrogenophaga sp.]|uniref:hypothetical protein n=1 Tax=Hydrogenophaga sp. TaxID=1904254 RepID=UPI00271EB989|nr:hypothetical protein [Hydrogenophaga sp.]MDO9436088.1 hypothetical protein [Hydrogenophaga sp.]